MIGHTHGSVPNDDSERPGRGSRVNVANRLPAPRPGPYPPDAPPAGPDGP